MDNEIRIMKQGDGYYTVYQGDSFCPDLSWDEMLAQIVELSHPVLIKEREGRGRFGMLTDEEYLSKLRRFWSHMTKGKFDK